MSLPPTYSSRPAATLILLRERDEGAPDVLMLERAATMRFAAGALVFPGGAVDPDDRELAARHVGDPGLDPDDTAARVAAIRETIEEAGLAVGIRTTSGIAPDADMVAAVRAGLAGGTALGVLLDQAGLTLALGDLRPFARWWPTHVDRPVFDTRFYLARAPDGMEAEVDGTENVALLWARAADLARDAKEGRVRAIFPTLCNLQRLAVSDSFAAAIAYAAAFPIEAVRPWTEMRDGVQHLCIPDHLGYPVVAMPVEGLARG